MSDSGPAAGAPGLHAALVRHTGYLVSRCGMYAARQFAQRLESIDLTPRLWGALNVLDAEGPVSQHELGQAIGMDPSSMVGTIDELESRGLVTRQNHPTDRRAHALHVTAAGRKTLARGRTLAAAAQNDLLAPLSPEDRRQLHDLLLRIAQAAGGRASDGPASTAPPA
ncbi:MAG: MarR family winged helix-turn-helix transcriptional regulator [Solirubrobacteraceae bacterium]